jgi:hypothetical protein
MLDAEVAGKVRRRKGAIPMAHARVAERTVPPVPMFPIVAAVAAVLVAGALAFFAADPFGLHQPDPTGPNPLVVAAERRWEIERKAQMGYIDPDIRSAREWEKQRQQVSGALS